MVWRRAGTLPVSFVDIWYSCCLNAARVQRKLSSLWTILIVVQFLPIHSSSSKIFTVLSFKLTVFWSSCSCLVILFIYISLCSASITGKGRIAPAFFHQILFHMALRLKTMKLSVLSLVPSDSEERSPSCDNPWNLQQWDWLLTPLAPTEEDLLPVWILFLRGLFPVVGGVVIVFLLFFSIIVIRHLRGFWFSRKLRGDQGQARALADGRPGVDGLGTVGRQHSSVLPNAACDGQTGLVPHGFCECQLRRNTRRERVVYGTGGNQENQDAATQVQRENDFFGRYELRFQRWFYCIHARYGKNKQTENKNVDKGFW